VILCDEKDKRIIAYAFRYALGRMSSCTLDIQEVILDNVDSFRSWELRKFVDEIKQHNHLGMECDIMSWNEFIEKLEPFI